MKFKKNLAVAISTLTLATSFAGCGTGTQPTKEKGLFSGYDNYQYYATEKNLSGSVMNLRRTPVKSYDQNLGRGYNVIYGNFFSTDDVHLTNPVLDTEKLASDGFIYSRPIQKKDTIYISGLTATSYEEKFNAKVGITYKGAFFKSSFDISFNSSNDLTTQDSFEKTIREIGKQRDYIDLSYLSMNDLKKYVTPSAQADINGDLSPDKLLTKYGTHVMCDIELGGRMEINYVYHNKNKMSTEEIDAKAKETYNGISAKEGTDFSKEVKEFTENSEFNAYQWGGTTDDDISTLEAAQHAYNVWDPSLDDSSNYDFINVGDMNNPYAFIPIWDFADDPGRAKAISDEYNAELDKNGTYFNGTQKVVDDNSVTCVKMIYFGFGKNSNAAKSDLRTKMQNDDPNAPKVEFTDYDLNAGAGGDCIYMGYTTTTQKNQSLTDILLGNCSGKKDTLPDYYKDKTYSKDNFHLNENAGGDYIIPYLTRDPAAGSPLIDVGIEFNKGNYTFLKNNDWNGWTSVGNLGDIAKLNLNLNAGGKDIYMWKRR